MDHTTVLDRPSSDSPIPTTLKRKRGPSHSDGVSGDLAGGKPVPKQGKDDHVDGLASEEIFEEDEEDSGDDSDSSGDYSSLNSQHVFMISDH